jgi:hypothetical protein
MTNPDLAGVINGALAPMQIIAETVAGYHKKLTDGGINDESAGRMAEEFHAKLLRMIPETQPTAKRR